MAKRRILRAILWLLSLPLIVVSRFLEVVTPSSIRLDLDRCITVVGEYGASVPDTFIKALIVAEDHRSKLHPGVDAIAIARAIWVRVTQGQVQGASTIEQQFVRVVSNRYERTVLRKLREQMLALMLVRYVTKHAVASAYLSVAFYGVDSVGISGLKTRFGEDLSQVSINQALRMVTQLKYPRPHIPTEEWYDKVSIRCQALLMHVEDAANKSLQRTVALTGSRPA